MLLHIAILSFKDAIAHSCHQRAPSIYQRNPSGGGNTPDCSELPARLINFPPESVKILWEFHQQVGWRISLTNAELHFLCSPLPVSCSGRGNENKKHELKAQRMTSARVWVWFSAPQLALPALFSLLHTSPARGVCPSDPSSLLSCLPPSLCPRALVADCVTRRLNEAALIQ